MIGLQSAADTRQPFPTGPTGATVEEVAVAAAATSAHRTMAAVPAAPAATAALVAPTVSTVRVRVSKWWWVRFLWHLTVVDGHLLFLNFHRLVPSDTGLPRGPRLTKYAISKTAAAPSREPRYFPRE